MTDVIGSITPETTTPQVLPKDVAEAVDGLKDAVDAPGQAQQEPAFGVHVIMMPDGQFAIQATGEPNLGEMYMLLARATKSVEARMVAETVAQVQKQNKSSIITPGR